MSELTHVDESGKANMVDVGGKESTDRRAVAVSCLRTRPDVIKMIADNSLAKGDVLAVARVAGIMAAKKTHELIPLCHPLPLDKVAVEFKLENDAVLITASASCRGRTGVEMEALTAASTAALTVYDMCKAVDKGMVIEQTRLLEKHGGKSGSWLYDGEKR